MSQCHVFLLLEVDVDVWCWWCVDEPWESKQASWAGYQKKQKQNKTTMSVSDALYICRIPGFLMATGYPEPLSYYLSKGFTLGPTESSHPLVSTLGIGPSNGASCLTGEEWRELRPIHLISSQSGTQPLEPVPWALLLVRRTLGYLTCCRNEDPTTSRGLIPLSHALEISLFFSP